MDIRVRTRNMLIDRGAVEFGAFKLKLHEKDPAAPLSPFYFNLRTPTNPKPGPLTLRDCELVAGCIWEMVQRSGNNGVVFSAVCPIPNAGIPIVHGLERIIPRPRGFKIVQLVKEITKAGRRIVPAPGFPYREGERVLLFDDLITKADTKLESIYSLEQQGCVVAGLAVLIDRQQGGVTELERRGYKVIVAYTATLLFQSYKNDGKIDQEKLDECLAYISNN